MYDELLRIPLILAGPGIGKQIRSDLARQTDLAPTLASLAGLRWPSPVDGRDLSRDATGPDAVFLEYYSKHKWVNPIRTIRTREWKYSCYDHSGQEELYSLAKDPHELANLAGKEPVQPLLRKRLDAWFRRA